MSTAQFLGLVAAILWAGAVAAPEEKDEVAVVSLFSGGICAGLAVSYALGFL